MPIDINIEQLRALLRELCRLPNETEWVEFKHNNADAPIIGKYISAIANSSALIGKQSGYIVWGVDDTSHKVIGTSFKPSTAKHKQQELESWLLQKTAPKIDFRFYDFTTADDKAVVILEVQAATHTPVQFDGSEYIRVGSYKKRLNEFKEKERALWRVFDKTPFEYQSAAVNITVEDVLKLIDYPSYFDLTKQALPEGRTGILKALEAERFINCNNNNSWNISNLGAILFARKLQDFRHLTRKAVRLILYKGNSRIETIREREESKGYAVGYEGLVDYLKTLLPSNEEIGKSFRKEVPMYPDLAIRELVANAIIHQDFSLSGTGPMIELFETRMEITNPGVPLVDPQRFLDSPPRSRNEAIASFMRRINICEERGTGIDKVVLQTELYQLPAPIFEQTDHHTKVILSAHKEYKKMEPEERIRACYFHCCLKYVNREVMNNTSLRDRFKMDTSSSAMASRVIKQTIDAGLIRLYDPKANRKTWRYIPFWVA